MRQKREEAQQRAEARRQRRLARAASKAQAADEELITPLRLLGFSAAEARQGAAMCESLREAPIEARLRRALSALAPGHRKPARAGTQ
jgi:hypothetical protein